MEKTIKSGGKMFFELIRNRRSARVFQEKIIEPEKIEAIKEAALRSPSSRSLNPWEFVFITDKNIIENLSKAKPHGSSFLKTASLAVAVTGNPDRCDVWIEDCSIASIYIQLACEALGLKSCWCQIRKRQHSETKEAEMYVKEILNIPANYRVLSIIGIGYAESKNEGHGKPYVEEQMNKIHSNKF